MPPPESSAPGRPPYLLPPSIPNLTDKIVRPNNWQYYAGGAFGDVFRCRYTSDDGEQEVAVKAFRLSFFVDIVEPKRDGDKAARMIHRELGIWRRLNHRNIVPFLGITYGFGKEGNASLVSIWMPHGTLHTFLEAHADRLTVAHRLQLLLDIANGLDYLHSFPVVHGDLSSNNVLLDQHCNACLADFGCASLIGELPEGLTYLKASTVRPGTLRWTAPEHVSPNEEGTKHTIKSDIYSLGNMALLVLSGKYPWSEVQHDAHIVLNLFQGIKPTRPTAPPIDDEHWALIEQCWSAIPQRPLASHVVFSLQRFLCPYPPPQLLRDLLGLPTPSSSISDRSGSDELCDNADSESSRKESQQKSESFVLGPLQDGPPPSLVPFLMSGQIPPTRQPMVAVPYLGPWTPATVAGPSGMSPHPYDGFTTWPENSALAELPQPNNDDRIYIFAEGLHYGPVLEPLLAKLVHATIKINPLLGPPLHAQGDFLRWNMLFPASSDKCSRTTEPRRPWFLGRMMPATHPRVTHIRIISRVFPWMIHARAQNLELGVTCWEVVDAISACMYNDASKQDFHNPGYERRRQIWDKYKFNRSGELNTPGKRLGEGLRRLDWLGSASKFGGLVANDTFVKERCGDVIPCTFELQCLESYPGG